MPAGGRSFSLFSVFLIAGLFMGWQPSNHCQTASSGPSCVSSGLSDLRPSGQVMSGQGRILLGRNRGPTRSDNPGVKPAPARPLSQSNAQPEVRAGQVRPSHATQCLHVGPSVNGTLSGCPRLWPVPSARPALGRARDPAWARLGPPLRLRAPCGSNCQWAFCPGCIAVTSGCQWGRTWS
jgi:hypothetical protein